MAVKTDVSKAYDRVEWNFLETIMKVFGFSATWISWIMETVRSVEYAVLINGTPYGKVLPSCGIRQGDPLSPYLFILCADILSHLINSQVASGHLQGIKIGNGVPPITHLQFADDSLFFCRANKRNCQALKDAFDVYEYYSGQIINTSKSLITFGSRVHGSRQNALQQILNISNKGGGGKYLGLPEQFGRKKKEMFEYIVERVRQRTANWSGKFLSPAGKEVLLKSVAAAMPVYAMSCFKLPLGLISELESILMNFWWKKNASSRGISWIAWKRLQYSKKEGGLGFRNLAKFNDALLAKQAWRIIQYPNSLFAKVMKARYFPDNSVTDASAKKNQSYGWSSILVGLDLLKKGLRVAVGDGSTIRVNIDNVIADHPPRPICSMDPHTQCTLSAFIQSHGSVKSWNNHTAANILEPTDFDALMQIYIPQTPVMDKIIWHYNPSGVYTVRSGYWLATHDPSDMTPAPNIPHGSVESKNQIWKLKILPKIKHFLWNVLSKSLGTATRLVTRGVVIETICKRCKQSDETINHTLFTCPSLQTIWNLANLPLQNSFDITDHELNISYLLSLYKDSSLSLEQKLLPFWLIWNIWKGRNNFVFNNKEEDHQQTLSQAKADVSEWTRTLEMETRRMTISSHSVTNINWTRPAESMVKCNFDVSYTVGTKKTIGGWMVRNHLGTELFWGSSLLRAANSPLEV
ncbi:PREDICTED: uncharacterized protein LOC104748809 [Camelina sativa]|uniref:Uncharacterized protein LOC104748809 n=1 Tax=Camelina sativa TaxID=90675 RepID=A0ABM0WBM5_CAMSA|nr:PREDICTED: uncharacterized protein LOC104748809 [Camelina sativa]